MHHSVRKTVSRLRHHSNSQRSEKGSPDDAPRSPRTPSTARSLRSDSHEEDGSDPRTPLSARLHLPRLGHALPHFSRHSSDSHEEEAGDPRTPLSARLHLPKFAHPRPHSTTAPSSKTPRPSAPLDRSGSPSPSPLYEAFPGPEDPHLADAHAGQQMEVPVVATCEEPEAVAHTRPGDQAPRFQCDVVDGTSSSARFNSARPSGFFTALALFDVTESWAAADPELQRFEDLYRKYIQLGLSKFLVICSGQETQGINAFRRGPGAKYKVPMAPDPDWAIRALFASGAFPRFYLLDNFYTIVQQAQGEVSPAFALKVHQLAQEMSPSYLMGMKFTVTDIVGESRAAISGATADGEARTTAVPRSFPRPAVP